MRMKYYYQNKNLIKCFIQTLIKMPEGGGNGGGHGNNGGGHSILDGLFELHQTVGTGGFAKVIYLEEGMSNFLYIIC